ncbi:MAG: hypothetical protein D6788_06855, partial [Planctomycetota bacterium]
FAFDPDAVAFFSGHRSLQIRSPVIGQTIVPGHAPDRTFARVIAQPPNPAVTASTDTAIHRRLVHVRIAFIAFDSCF